MSNVVPMKLFKNYHVEFERKTSYTAKVFATSDADAKHMVLRVLESEDIEEMTEMLISKGTTYTNVESVKEV